MTTLVTGRRVRIVGSDSFADLTAAPLIGFTPDGLLFDGTLDAATIDKVRARMTSRDDADQAARAQLRTDRDALPATDPLRRLYNYVLGE